jgi:hypothetical protein
MIARHINLGRVVIVIGGVLVFLALLALIWSTSARPVYWTGVYVAVLTGCVLTVLLGRGLGGLVAERSGRARQQGHSQGALAAVALLAVGIAALRWFTN